MLLKLRYLIPFILFPVITLAQAPGMQQPKGKVTGKVLDAKTNAPIEYATIGLFRAVDSMLVTGNITKGTGEFSIEAPYGKYYLNVDFIGYKARTLAAFEITEAAPEAHAGTVRLEASAQNLDAVEVEVQQSQFQVGIDKKVFNVGKDLTSAGASASEVLQNVPSVTVDMDGNVALRGSGGVRILIDGKPSGLTGVSKADILEQIPASSIESIEVITNPSAKYDSEGMAGIINIVLKKQKKDGFNGMVSVNAGTGHRYNGSINLNYSKNRINLFASYDAGYRNMIGSGINNRQTTINDSVSYLDQNSDILRTNISHSARAGFDWRINDKNTITLSALYKIGRGKRTSDVNYLQYDSNHALTNIFTRDNTETDIDDAFDYAINYRKNFKKKGQELAADLLYTTAVEDEANDIVQQFYHPDGTPVNTIPIEQKNSSYNTQVNMLGQLDYAHPLKDAMKIEAGAKGNIRETDIDFIFYNYDPATVEWLNDTSLSNRFRYEEQVYAAYAIFNGSYRKFGYKLGVRAENTITLSELVTTGESYKNDYLDLFPSVHLMQDLAGKNKVSLSYTRRINRPNMQNLNPFDDYEDPYNLRTGNPFLKPEYISSFDAGHTKYWERYSLTSGLYYRYTTDMMQRVKRLDTTGVTITSFENLATGISYGAELTLTATPAKWARIMASFNYYRNIVDGGNIREGYTSDAYSWNTRLNASFTVWKNLDIQLTGNYRAPMEVPIGTILEMYSFDLGAKKDILKNKASINMRVSDVLNSQRFRIDAAGPGFVSYSEHRRDSRAIFLGFSYKINSYKDKPKDRRQDNNQGGGDMGDF